jgi:glycine betaine/proline transport system substrate-binding protein
MLKKVWVSALAIAALAGLATGSAEAASKGKVKIAYVEWSDSVVATNIAKTVLEQAGYDVTLTPLAAAAMWQAVATGEADAMLAGWLPVTHKAYYDKLKSQVELTTPNITGARLGWATPDYTDIKSIEDLKTKGSEVDNKVIGIDPGAGLMRASEKAIKDYGLSNIKLVEGSDATMVATLKDAIDKKQPIVVTAWTPHWMFARWKLRYLNDPKGSLGAEETVYTVSRKDLAKDMPEVHKILKNMKFSLEEEQKVMVWNEESGAKPAETAARWVKENPEIVKSWLQ